MLKLVLFATLFLMPSFGLVENDKLDTGDNVLYFERSSYKGRSLPHPKVYIVNLDIPADQRWDHVMKDHTKLVIQLHKVMRELIPGPALVLVEKIAAGIEKYLPQPYAAEIKGIASSLGLELGDLVLGNLMYDLSAFCTSIVAQDEKGQIWHARNLDYKFADILRNITVQVHFQRQGKTVYSAVTYAGYVGIASGQRPKAFSITIDERDRGAWWMNALMAILDRKAAIMSFLIRDVLNDETDFGSAVEKLSNTPTIASVYFIVGGVKPAEGAIITKGRIQAIDTYYIDPLKGRWFVVETNYDHWRAPPKHDDRRTPAINALNALGPRNISATTLLGVLSTRPVLNKGTTYSVIMSAAHPDVMSVWIRTDAHNNDLDFL